MQPIRTEGQMRWPDDDAIMGLAVSDNFRTGNDFPAQGQRGSLPDLGLRGVPRPDHDHLIKKPVRHPSRQRVQDNFQSRGLGHMPAPLTVNKFGLDSEAFSFGENVHSARGLHTTVTGVGKFSRYGRRIVMFNSPASPAFPGNQCPASGFLYRSVASPFPQSKWDVIFMSMASP